MTETASRSRFRRFTRASLRGMLITILVLVLLHGAALFVLGRRLDARIGALKAAGHPVTMADLAGPPIPDADNAAVALQPILARVSASETLTAAQDLALRTAHGEASALTPEERARLDRALAAFRAEIPALEAALSRPRARFAVNWEAGFDVRIEHLTSLRKVARWLVATATHAAEAGDADASARSISLTLRLANTLQDEPLLISQLVRFSLVRLAASALRESADRQPAISRSQELRSLLAGTRLRPGWERAVYGERTIQAWTFAQVNEGGPAALAAISHDGPLTERLRQTHILWRCGGKYLVQPWLYADQLAGMEAMAQLTANAGQPDARDRDNKVILSVPKYAIITRLNLPSLECAAIASDAAQAEVDGSRLYLALLAHKAQHGAYPETLDVLRPRWGGARLADPFSGGAYRYRRQGSGFLLYSLGRNRKDDGGITPQRQDESAKSEGAYDIVWQRQR